MDEIRRTPARHRLLQELFEGDMRFYHGLNGVSLVRANADGTNNFLSGAEKRTVYDIGSLLAPSTKRMGSWEAARITDDAKLLLDIWNARYGTPKVQREP